MKRFILLALAVLSAACSDYSSDDHKSSGIYLNERRVVSIGSVFMGGGTANPSKGSSHQCHIFENSYEYMPAGVPCIVYINGFRYADVNYSKPGLYLEGVYIDEAVLESDSPLSIRLNQGKYEGGCESVSAVDIINYDRGTVKTQSTGEMNDDGKIDILISLKGGRKLRIHYRGKIPFDGCY